MGGGVSDSGLGLNERAWQLAEDVAANAEVSPVGVRTLQAAARVIHGGNDPAGGVRPHASTRPN